MAAKRVPRTRLLVDRRVQGAIILRVVLYWIVFLVTLMLLLLCWRIIADPIHALSWHFHQMWLESGPALVASCVLLPLVIFDILRVSNRFAGPLFRLRRSMRALARGEIVRPISFREGDFWLEVAHEFNAILARIQQQEQRPVQRTGEQQQDPVGAASE
jgi:hypothetical protein